jgi:flagellar biosynthesis protein FlhA
MSTLALKAESTGQRMMEAGTALAVIFIIALLIVPLPPFLLDLFLTLSIASALVVLLVALYVSDPLEFSSFPALLLILTLFRLALNVSTTRLILGQGHAGEVVKVFGEFVIGGNYVVGLVIFLILVGINFIVITKGAGRVAEVAARFTLDAMPGKQMAIDADLGAGLIDEATARERREKIARQADFYGAMDGASKFVKGDAVAGLLITGINIAGGIIIGVAQREMTFSKAATTYTILTVGDGLVSQIPALIISTAAGLIVTHTAAGARMGTVLGKQVGGQPRALYIAGATLAVFGLLPGLPSIPFLALAAMLGAMGRMATVRQRDEADAQRILSPLPEPEAIAPPSPVQDLLQLDPIELELGYGLIPLAEESGSGDLLARVGLLRKQAALESGVLIPAIRIRDDIRLGTHAYAIKLRGTVVAQGEVLPRHLLALDTGSVVAPIEGIETTDPSFGLPARWIAPRLRADAEAMGYAVVDATTMIATHLMETLKSHAAELLGRQDVQEMLDTVKRANPALVDELVPAKLSLGVLHRVLQRLLRERVPIRDLVTILEAVGDAIETIKDPDQLAEHARRALGPVLARLHADADGIVRAIALGPRLEATLAALFTPRGSTSAGMLAPDQLVAVLRDLQRLATEGPDGRPLPLIVPPGLRLGVRRLVEPVLPKLPVLSLAELPPTVQITTTATWEMPHAA